MTTECMGDRDFWPTQEEIEQPGFAVCATVRRGDIVAGIYVTGHWFHLTWTDGVANSWRERYSLLSYALARMAIIAYCEESDWELGARSREEAEFVALAKPFLQSTVV